MADDNPLGDLCQSFFAFRQDKTACDLMRVAAYRCVDSGLTKDMTDEFLNPENKDVLEFIGWELIGLLSKLDDQIKEEHNLKLLDAIVETCSPKEVCLGIMEQMDVALPLAVFETLLLPLQKAFCHLNTKKIQFLKMIVSKITSYIRRIQFSNNEDNTTHCKLEWSSSLYRAIELIEFLINDSWPSKTLQKFNNMSNNGIVKEEELLQTWEPVQCLIGILEAISSENLTSQIEYHIDDQDVDSSTVAQPYQGAAVMILTLLGKFHYTAIGLIEYSLSNCDNRENHPGTSCQVQEDNIEETDGLSLLGLGCLSYLLIAEKVDALHFPQVFRSDYLLRIQLGCISCLLQRTDASINHKGLELLCVLIDKIEDGSLEHYILRFPRFLDVPKALINIMIYSSSQTIRKQATSMLLKLITKLDTRGRYVLLRYLLLDCSHAGVAALLIHNIKEEVHKNFNSRNKNHWFRGPQLISLLHPLFKIPRGAGTEVDLVPETERIMASLNSFRYILLRDREDETTLWKTYSMFEREFLEPLRESLKVSRVRYLAVQKQGQNEPNQADEMKEHSGDKIDFTVTTPDGTPISEMCREDQIQVLQSGLYALDMMDCILAHITEIANSRCLRVSGHQ